MEMASSDISALLIEAPVNRHFAQFHRSTQSLTEAVGLFAEAGLRRSNGVVVIATPVHTELLLERFAQGGMDPEEFRRSGQLEILDAEAVLSRFMRGAMPDWTDFRRTVGTVLESVQTFGRNIIRAYGEMVNVLWQNGRTDAAIRVEEYWNELARLYPFSLFCSYMLDGHQQGGYAGPLHEIGRTHSDILVTADDDTFRLALDEASKDVFGLPLSKMLSLSGQEDHPGEHRLPSGQRTMLWIMRNMPASSAPILERARRHYQDLRHT
jgi:hypothetical protein